MNRKFFSSLLALTVACIIAAAIVWSKRTAEVSAVPMKPASLFPELRAQLPKISTITIKKKDTVVNLAKRDGVWVSPDVSSYPANKEKVAGILTGFDMLELVEEKTSTVESYSKLSVEGPDGDPGTDSAKVTLAGEDGKEIAALIVGKNAPGSGKVKRRYVRKDGDKVSWLANTAIETSGAPTEWVDKNICDIPVNRVKSLVRNGGDLDIEIFRAAEPEDEFQIKDPPQGTTPKAQSYFTGPAGTFGSLQFQNVHTEADFKAEITSSTTVLLTTFDGLKLEAKVQSTSEPKYFASLKAAYDESARMNEEAAEPAEAVKPEEKPASGSGDGEAKEEAASPEPSPTPEAKKKTELKPVEDVKKEAEEINKRTAGWVYELPTWKGGGLMRPKKDFFESGKRVTASHILVAYEGATRSSVEGRTKEEARATA
ncbi:DUF4340 domain-containing protein, partial [Candidatus Poribacteria bacterium]|nr:DUF4340 domain-containing protein [Candidatus Poribacteria bacterium]